MDLNDFFNEGFGWICRQCDREHGTEPEAGKLSRIMSEGEAESKQPRMSNRSLAKWADPAHRVLVCPRCGISELADKS